MQNGGRVEINTLGVVGAGVMGSDIAFVSALAGKRVIICDVDNDALGRALDRVRDLAARAQKRGQIDDAGLTALLARITTTTRDADLADCNLAIEAVSERMDLKLRIFARLDATLKPGALIASNTSGLSITELAQATGRPDAVLGVHFFNPAAVMRLVELIQGRQTSDATLAVAESFARELGKAPVRVRECPGFLVNRVLVRAMAEAYRHAGELGVAPAQADAAVVAAGPAPMGPFALGDLIGLDTMDHIQRDLEGAYGERFSDGGAIATEVAAGRLGRKSGGGFVTDDPPVDHIDAAAHAVAERYYFGALNEALRCHDDAIAARPDIDLAMCLGAGWKRGPLTWADEQGAAAILRTMQELAASAGGRFQPTPLLRERAADGRSLIGDGDTVAVTASR
jgi:3-hydroxyacyl-CoA dehydrogenase